MEMFVPFTKGNSALFLSLKLKNRVDFGSAVSQLFQLKYHSYAKVPYVCCIF